MTTVLALASVATFSGSFTVNKGILRAQRQTGLGKVTGKPNSRQRSAYSDSVIVNSVRTYGITPLSPGEPGAAGSTHNYHTSKTEKYLKDWEVRSTTPPAKKQVSLKLAILQRLKYALAWLHPNLPFKSTFLRLAQQMGST